MEAIDDNRFGIRLAFRPLRDMFVFTGRSTRSEVWAFFLLGILANMITITISGPSAPLMDAAKMLWGFLWGFPLITLFVRRLHDQDRSGRWALSLLGLAFLIVVMSGLPQSAESPMTVTINGTVSHPAFTPLSIGLGGIVVTIALAQFVVMYLLPGTYGRNRFGPDPRLDPPEQTPASA
jgi:uncharacterized membrane protein YhaH (DUF805 family)